MKKRMLQVTALFLTMALFASGCGSTQSDTGKNPSPAEEEASKGTPQETASSEELAPSSAAEIVYSNITFDFSDQISEESETLSLLPKALDMGLSVADSNEAAGVQLVASQEEGNTTDYYLNALVSGNKLVFSSSQENPLVSVESSISGSISIQEDQAEIIPAPISASQPIDEIITIILKDDTVYQVHTLNEMLPDMSITGSGVENANAGVYDFALDKFLLRVNTEGELVYYRNLGCTGEVMAENFGRQVTADGAYYSYFVELHPDYRNANGGFSSGMYVVMDENYRDIDQVVLLPNAQENHTHGTGYLDQHEFVILGASHYLTLSYTPQLVSNLPETVKGIDGGSTAYVWAGIFQEIKDGKVLHEISTTDYPLLYDSAVEKIDYENSTDQGIEVAINDQMIPSLADGWMDYVHPNSLDYTLDENGDTKKLLVSMRDQSAVYQFDLASGAIDWILGGKASTLSGYDEFTSSRTDEKGNEFSALTYGQHYARYTNKNADGTLTGNPQISIFDNDTGTPPFLTTLPVPTLTRTLKADIEEAAGTVVISDIINGTDLNQKTEGYHIASHCGSVDYQNETSVVIGWGLHGVIDNIGAMAPQGTMTDAGFDDLRAGSRPVVTEYDMLNDKVTFELTATRNANFQGHEAFFSYRTYKTAE